MKQAPPRHVPKRFAADVGALLTYLRTVEALVAEAEPLRKLCDAEVATKRQERRLLAIVKAIESASAKLARSFSRSLGLREVAQVHRTWIQHIARHIRRLKRRT